MKRKASAQWKGSLKDGSGSFSAESGALSNIPYSFARRFENEPGTNPEELIAAAHASCFAMALSAELGKLGITPVSLDATATVTFEKQEAGFTITESHLEVVGKLSAPDAGKWQQATDAAKKGCPISRVLNTKITLDAKLA
ncbi:MAG TPA: OsmC family protein [Polyangia bacterium]|jgi:osmotically inducible protein OsmC|nr:OsmC family protein [Polyangia bacterium]